MASVQELIALSQHNVQARKSPLISILEGIATGVGQVQSDALARQKALLDIENTRQEGERKNEAYKLFIQQLAGAQENNTNSSFQGTGPAVTSASREERFKTAFHMSSGGEVSVALQPKEEKSPENFTLDQTRAISTGNLDKISTAFNGKIPKEVIGMLGASARADDLTEERLAKRRDAHAREKMNIVTRFNSDPSVKKSRMSIDAVNTIRGLVTSGNPIAANSIPTYMARASGEVGNLSEADKKPFGGSRAITQRLAAVWAEATTGEVTGGNAKFLLGLTDLMEKKAYANMENLATFRAKQYSKANDYLKEGDILNSLLPEITMPPPVNNEKTIPTTSWTPGKEARLEILRKKQAAGALK